MTPEMKAQRGEVSARLVVAVGVALVVGAGMLWLRRSTPEAPPAEAPRKVPKNWMVL